MGVELAREILDGLAKTGKHEIIGLARKVNALTSESLQMVKLKQGILAGSKVTSENPGSSLGADGL